MVDDRKHPFIATMDIVIFLFAISELVEAIFHVGISLFLPEAAFQVLSLLLRGAAVWHAHRHL